MKDQYQRSSGKLSTSHSRHHLLGQKSHQKPSLSLSQSLMDSYGKRPSTEPNGANLVRHHTFPMPPEHTNQQAGTSRYRALRGKSVSSGHLDSFRECYDQAVGDNRACASAGASTEGLTKVRGWLQARSGSDKVRNGPEAMLEMANTSQPTLLHPRFKKCSIRTDVPAKRLSTATETRQCSQGESSFHEPSPTVPSAPYQIGLRSEIFDDKDRITEKRDKDVLLTIEVARLEAETDRILASQLGSPSGRSQTLERSTTSSTSPSGPILQKLTFLKRAIKLTASRISPETITAGRQTPAICNPATSFHDIIKGNTRRLRSKSGIHDKKKSPSPADSGTSENPIVQSVTIQVLSTTFPFSVTKDTSPGDIISTAASMFPKHVNADVCAVLECNEDQGLRRRLRQYERVHEVIGTWDHDQRNSLVVLPRDSVDDLADLKLPSVSSLKCAPTGFAFQLYHSSRPGNWNKYWVTLSETGHVFATNQPTSHPVNTIPLCHLSVCDIYTTSTKITARFGLPARFCFAIKGQTIRNARREVEENIHLFSTDIEQLANRFYELIQRWRSWYIVHERVESMVDADFSSHLPNQRPGRPGRLVHPGFSRGRQPSFELSSSSRTANLDDPLDFRQLSKTMGEFETKADLPPATQRTAEASNESSQRPEKQVESKLNEKMCQEMKFSSISTTDGGSVVKRTQSSGNRPRDTPEKDGPSSTMSLPEMNEAKPWFPSALEHSARTRQLSRKQSHRFRRAPQAQTPPHGRRREIPCCRSAPHKLETKQARRHRPSEYGIAFAARASPGARPHGLDPRKSGRGGRPLKEPLRGQAGRPPNIQMSDPAVVPPVPARSARRRGTGI